MNRVFYYSGYRMTVFNWRGKSFVGAASFEPDVDGYEKFTRYLQLSAKTPTNMLLDVIEEDFRQETIPHVHGRDRKAVISRLLDRYYRSSRQFSYHEVLGREKAGRRDSKVLIGAITNPALIMPWIQIIDECSVALSGVWSLPLLSKKLLPIIDARKGPVLLVSQQVNSNLRQTFFRDGKMLASRQSVVNQDVHDISNIGTFAVPELDRTINFLRNQRQIKDDEVVNVHIMASADQVQSLQNVLIPDELHNYHFHRISELHDRAGVRGFPEKFCDGLFAKLCMEQQGVTGHYGDSAVYSRFYYAMGSAALYVISVILLIAGLLVTESNISEAMMFEESGIRLAKREAEYRRVYSEKYESYEEVFADANLMNSAVRLSERLENSAKISPDGFMLEFSELISRPQMGEVKIDRIKWKTQQLVSTGKRGALAETAVKTNPASADRIQHVATVHGRIPVPANSFRDSVNRISNVISLLQKSERVEKVEALELPVEVRPEKKFSSESGQSRKPGKESSSGRFVIRIIMNGREGRQ